MSEGTKSKETIVVEMVKAGIHTRDEIREAADCTSGSLASYLTGMRNAAKFTGVDICPVEVNDDDGKKVFTVGNYEEIEAAKAARVGSRSTAAAKSPAERLEAAEKRVTRCENAEEAAIARYEKDGSSEELQLRAAKAEIELKLAMIELEKAQDLVDSSDVVEGDNSEVVEETEDDLM